MDTDHLQAFDQVVRTGSFSRAGWVLNLSQPTVSTRIQALEQVVGGPLFRRQGRTITLTPLGESFLPYARRVLGVLSEGLEAARQTQDGQRGRLTLGIIESMAGCLLAKTIARFHTAHPLVDLMLRSADGAKVIEHLHDGVVELGMVGWPCSVQSYPELVPVLQLRDPLVLVVSRRHPLADSGQITLEEAAKRCPPFLFTQWGNQTRSVVERLTALEGPMQCLPIHTARHLLRQGVGISFFPRTFIQEELDAGHLAEVTVSDLPPLYREVAVMRHPRTGALSAAAESFLQLLRQEAWDMVTPLQAA